jgi:hypothetical protein
MGSSSAESAFFRNQTRPSPAKRRGPPKKSDTNETPIEVASCFSINMIYTNISAKKSIATSNTNTNRAACISCEERISHSHPDKQISDTGEIVDEMVKSLVKFSDEAMRLGILDTHSSLTQSFRDLTKSCLSLSNVVLQESRCESESNMVRLTHFHDTTQPLNSESSKPDKDQRNLSEIPVAEEEMSRPSNSRTSVPEPTACAMEATIPNLTTQLIGANWELPANHVRSGPTTASTSTSTLAWRLHRTCIEHGYHLLTDPVADHGKISRTFGFVLTSLDSSPIFSLSFPVREPNAQVFGTFIRTT